MRHLTTIAAALAAAACAGEPFTAGSGPLALEAPPLAPDGGAFETGQDGAPGVPRTAEGSAGSAPDGERPVSDDGAADAPGDTPTDDAGPVVDRLDGGGAAPDAGSGSGEGGGNTCWLRNTLDCVEQGATGYQCQTTPHTLELAGLDCEIWDVLDGVYCCWQRDDTGAADARREEPQSECTQAAAVNCQGSLPIGYTCTGDAQPIENQGFDCAPHPGGPGIYCCG